MAKSLPVAMAYNKPLHSLLVLGLLSILGFGVSPRQLEGKPDPGPLPVTHGAVQNDDSIIKVDVPSSNRPLNIAEAQPKPMPTINHTEAAKYGWRPPVSATPERVRRQDPPGADVVESIPWANDTKATRPKGSRITVNQETLVSLGIPANRPKLLANPKDAGIVTTADINQVPFSGFGKLYFSDPKGNLYECSGAYVSDYVVLTAAHCVYDVELKGFNKNYEFYQKYKQNRGLKKRVQQTLLYNGWFSSGDYNFAYDFAFLAMTDKTSTGYIDIGIPDDYSDWTAAGYPANYYNGEILQKLHGYKGSISKSVVETANNPMGSGCSGGPWFVNGTQRHKAIGVNSFSLEGGSGMFSPRFKSDSLTTLFNEAKKSAQSSPAAASVPRSSFLNLLSGVTQGGNQQSWDDAFHFGNLMRAKIRT